MSLLQPPPDILSLLLGSLPDSVTSDSDSGSGSGSNEDVLSYVAFLAAGLVELQEFDPEVWGEQLAPYLEDLPGLVGGAGATTVEGTIEAFREAVAMATSNEDDADSYGGEDDDQFEEVCNLRFK